VSEDVTKDMDGRPFQERVLETLDLLVSTLTSLETRFTILETRLDRQTLETKSMWEKAVAEIVETRSEMTRRFDNMERKLDVINRDMLQLRADQKFAESRLDKLEHGTEIVEINGPQ
jgi:tetrahydromethanopterin S-methyltransferase subunit G